ncbi:hypothetical protein E2C01_071309 [Portunus trituberculatus]|uniref:Uncharacterized protein n=1 Tax=Portunus trituberculatus TaxID=210409 RepID=A0A5B7I7V9_PORTR|nr:hypothetical protein [Portunus trituberculatus]
MEMSVVARRNSEDTFFLVFKVLKKEEKEKNKERTDEKRKNKYSKYTFVLSEKQEAERETTTS